MLIWAVLTEAGSCQSSLVLKMSSHNSHAAMCFAQSNNLVRGNSRKLTSLFQAGFLFSHGAITRLQQQLSFVHEFYNSSGEKHQPWWPKIQQGLPLLPSSTVPPPPQMSTTASSTKKKKKKFFNPSTKHNLKQVSSTRAHPHTQKTRTTKQQVTLFLVVSCTIPWQHEDLLLSPKGRKKQCQVEQIYQIELEHQNIRLWTCSVMGKLQLNVKCAS